MLMIEIEFVTETFANLNHLMRLSAGEDCTDTLQSCLCLSCFYLLSCCYLDNCHITLLATLLFLHRHFSTYKYFACYCYNLLLVCEMLINMRIPLTYITKN